MLKLSFLNVFFSIFLLPLMMQCEDGRGGPCDTRFRKVLKSPDRFASMLQRYREADFGNMHIKSVDLVYNDWYQSSSVVKVLHRFIL